MFVSNLLVFYQMFHSDMMEMRRIFVQLSEKVGEKHPASRPTFHSLCHPAVDQLLFGDDVVLSTQAFEKSHRHIAKIPFQRETNRTSDQLSLHRQIFSALFYRSFMVERAVVDEEARRPLREGLVSAKTTTVASIVQKQIWFGDESLHFGEDAVYNSLLKLVKVKGTFIAVTMKKEGINRDVVAGLACKSATGYRLASGCVVRPFQGAAKTKDCILQLADGSFAMVFGVFYLVCPVLACLAICCKRLDSALSTDGSIEPKLKLPLLRDSDSANLESSFILSDPSKIAGVWSAVLARPSENEFQLVFAVEK